ncbi:hypothetical protein QM012_004175 [Aureobasidium pullulans]|uniref:Uncharacterized protein n=1 Tax=Aureobasidium pullulans TaxID=5580 RepID=A0ABR0TT66_AURPU
MSTGKEVPEVNTTSLDNEEQVFPDPQWRTGLKARFPWNGAIALVTIILCANSSLIVLLVSDGKRQRHWAEKIGPSVLLSAFNGIANICFGVAIANGVAITWWRKALRGATIKELHRSWQFSSSIKDVVLYGRYFNFIALAALAAKLTIIDGILLQKAAGTDIWPDPAHNFTLDLYVNDTMPFTATFANRSGNGTTFIDWFGSDVHYWSSSGGIYLPNYSYCNGTCVFDVHGTGFGIDCQSEEIAMDYGTAVSQESNALSQSDNSSSLNVTAQRTLFDVNFQAIYGATGVDGDYSRIQMNLTFTNATATGGDSASCPGRLTRHSCILRPAIVTYPVTIEDSQSSDSTIYVSNMYLGHNTTSYGGQVGYWSEALQTYYTADEDMTQYMNGTFYNSKLQQLNDYSVVAYKDVLEDPTFFTGSTPTVLGGIVEALNRYLAGTSTMRYDRGQFFVDQTGAAGMLPFNFNRNSSTGCDYQYRDPLDYTILQINSLMFVLAVDPWNVNNNNNWTLTDNFKATQYGSSIHYVTDRRYMWAALATMLVCVLCVLPSYWGYWQLGRDVTLGPFEIANAFRAPVLDHPAVANAGVKDLIREVGQREVKYGAMVHNDASGRLAIAEPEAVRRVHPRIGDRRF